MYKIVIISTGPGNEKYLIPYARDIVKKCDLLLGQRDLLNWFPEAKKAIPIKNLKEVSAIIEDNKHLRIGILVSGDAGIYSLAQTIIKRFGKEAIEEIIPGISSITLAFARIKESWQDVKVVSFHGRPIDRHKIEKALKWERLAILCDKKNNAKLITSLLLEMKVIKNKEIYICQNLSLEDESIFRIGSKKEIEKLNIRDRELIILISKK